MSALARHVSSVKEHTNISIAYSRALSLEETSLCVLSPAEAELLHVPRQRKPRDAKGARSLLFCATRPLQGFLYQGTLDFSKDLGKRSVLGKTHAYRLILLSSFPKSQVPRGYGFPPGEDERGFQYVSKLSDVAGPRVPAESLENR